MSPQPQNRSLIFPVLMVVAGLALIIGSIWWTLNNQSRTAAWGEPGSGVTISQAAPANALQPASTRRIPYPNITRVSIADARAAYELKQAVFIDTRGEPMFSDGHIPGALDITETALPDRIGELDKNAWIITYCT
jgi:hypothetical protein